MRQVGELVVGGDHLGGALDRRRGVAVVAELGAGLVEQRDATALPARTAVCLGAFDGMHVGHQALLARARALGDRVGVVTFDPHPQQVLAPERAPRLLQTAVQRRRVCEALGVEHLVLLPFDREIAQMGQK